MTTPRAVPLTTAFALALTALSPRADAAGLRANLVDAKTLKLDGVPKEWPGSLVRLSQAVKGQASRSDLDAQGLVAYDESYVYVAADVTDDTFRAGADHLELALGFPGGTSHSVTLYPGEPGKTAGNVKVDGRAAQGARLVEAPKTGGYTLEARVPWSAFPEAATLRIGLRAALFAHDADASSAVEAVVGTAASSAYGSLPSLATDPEQALADGLMKSKGLKGAPTHNLIADVAGDALKERLMVYERYLVVLGPGFRKGTQYYFADTEANAKAGMMPSFETRDLTGDGQHEIILRKRFGSPTAYREVMQVLQFGRGDTPTPIFQHEVAVVTDKGSVINEVTFVPDGSKVGILVRPGEAKSYHAGNYTEATETSFDPTLLPWSTVKSQLYQYAGSIFQKAREESQAATPPPAAPPSAAPQPAAVAAPKPPPGPSASQLLDQVYALYKKDRGATGRPRHDMALDVAGSAEVERVLLHDRDLVVFGKGFKGGTGYSYLTLSQFAAASDITEVTARDLSGDGKAEILVKGVIHANGPGGESVDREVLLVFQVQGDALRRVFAAEIGRAIGAKKVIGDVKFVSAGRGTAIQLGPGRAVEWTEKTYPFNQDPGPVGGMEPLLLPWGSAKAVRYTWNGSGFAR
ncbi:sugar-binding protein [Chondromyces apiculatus]|uniref:Carbohydrate-binding domain-containing protein n=1 Tax=Chondromyces apiculatus DSM 436 TaxID=1192034 RepID=A0A017TH17_9BACT|nr:sugar-binding protein [Chondromyces apiculatus]EYF08543.1 Hypothetical protein CAP_4073 [Chondromyces apiculatus DSM 436]